MARKYNFEPHVNPEKSEPEDEPEAAVEPEPSVDVNDKEALRAAVLAGKVHSDVFEDIYKENA